jgi:hypothetical protein
MSNVDCWGTEEDIAECDFGRWGQRTCNHSKDVGNDVTEIFLKVAFNTITLSLNFKIFLVDSEHK